MPATVYRSFLGHRPDQANAPFNSARSGKNYCIHLHRDRDAPTQGWIEQAQGYVQKFSALPANDTTIRKISAISHKDTYNLYIPEHGGQSVTIVLATYTKTGFFTANPTVNRFGVWIRPYWNGASWVDEWRELTEMFIFELNELGVGGDNKKLYLDDATGSKYTFKAIDPTGIVFTADYFNDWTIVYAAFGDSENYDIVADSGYDGDRYFLQLAAGHVNTQFTNRIAGTKLIVYRSFLTAELPSTLSSYIYGLLSEARVTSGNSATDVSLMVGNRDTSFVVTGIDDNSIESGFSHTRTLAGVILDTGTMNVWQYAVEFGIAGLIDASAEDAVAEGTYYFKRSIVFDDGCESRLYDCVSTVAAEHTAWSATNSITVTASKKIGYYIYRSLGALPRRAKYLRVYYSTDNVTFHRCKDFDLRSATLWQHMKVFGAEVGGAHWYAFTPSDFSTDYVLPLVPTTKYLIASDFDENADTAEDQRGLMAMTDTGVIQFTQAVVVGRSCFAIGVRAGGTLYPNYIFATPSNGDGQSMYDCFGLVSTRLIDLEYNDGDQIVGLWPYGDRILAFKRQMLSVITSRSDGGFDRDYITKSDGLCSMRAIADFEEVVYWAGYNGIYSYSSLGVRPVNLDWLEEWKAISTTYKESTVVALDRVNRQLRFAFQTAADAYCERILDLDSGEWVGAELTNQPSKFAVDKRLGTVDFLSGTLIHTLGGGTRHNGTNFTFEYYFNDFIVASESGINALLLDIRVRYSSSVAITAQLYKDGVAQGSAVTLAATDTWVDIKAGLSFRCRRFSLKLTATTTAASQTIQIKEVTPRYQIIPGGVTGDRS